MSSGRQAQLDYSLLETRMLDEAKRRRKAAKIIAVLQHFLGTEDLCGRTVLDVGTSAGFIASALAAAGGDVIGVDIDAPGLATARSRFGHEVSFVSGSGSRLPLADASVDVVVFNHIYEHVVDADAVMADIRRVLKPEGVAYLGLGNRLGILEPHHGLPFLSWLPPRAADRYMRATGKGDHYYERYRTRRGLRRLTAGLCVTDYSLSLLAEPETFAATDVAPGAAARLPGWALRATVPLLPTYIWVVSRSDQQPRGPELSVPPLRLPVLTA